MKCSYWSDCGIQNGGCCELGMYSGRPGLRACAVCEEYDGPSRGAGDVVHNVAAAVGIKPCGGCKKRQAALNRVVPFS